jgi:ribosomal-protein-alanine N-acetyltransferase
MLKIKSTRDNSTDRISLKTNILKIELMNEKFIEQIYNIEKASFKESYTKQFLKYLLKICPNTFLIATINGMPIGYIVTLIQEKKAKLISLAIAPEWRKMGFGECLIKRILERIKSYDARDISLEVRETNYNAISLYKKLGFRIEGKIPNYYENQESALIFHKFV